MIYLSQRINLISERGMTDVRYIENEEQATGVADWVRGCANAAGWAADEAQRLAECVRDSAATVARKAYKTQGPRPVLIRLNVKQDAAALELHHEGKLGDAPCDCAAAMVAESRKTKIWNDAQLKTFQLRIPR